MRKIHPSLMLLSVLSTTASAQIAIGPDPSIIVEDSFDNPSYDIFNFNSADSGGNPDDISTASFSSSPDGNPGAALEIVHIHQIEPNFDAASSTSVQSFLVQNTIAHTPSTDGVISTIDFSIDIQTDNEFRSIFFIIEDADTGGGSSAGFTSILSDGDWHNVSVTGLDASDFSGRDLSGSNRLNFGFGFTSSLDVDEDAPAPIFILADNFNVSFTTTNVPEPSSSILAGLAILGAALRRSR